MESLEGASYHLEGKGESGGRGCDAGESAIRGPKSMVARLDHKEVIDSAQLSARQVRRWSTELV